MASITSKARTTSVSEAVIKDHYELKDYYNKIMNAADDDTKSDGRTSSDGNWLDTQSPSS
jgi:hypothetical protein